MSDRSAPQPEKAPGPNETSFHVFMPQDMISDAAAIASRLGSTVDVVLWSFWELAKPEIYTDCASPEDRRTLPATPQSAPKAFRALTAQDLPPEPLSFGGQKQSLTLAIPDRVLQEVQALAVHADRSTSWIFQKAFIIARTKF